MKPKYAKGLGSSDVLKATRAWLKKKGLSPKKRFGGNWQSRKKTAAEKQQPKLW